MRDGSSQNSKGQKASAKNRKGNDASAKDSGTRAFQMFLPPAAILLAMLALSLWNAHALSVRVARWQGQLETADAALHRGDWDGVRHALEESWQDWTASRTYLHITSRHDAAHGADALYRRCLALAEGEGDLLPELTELRWTLAELAETERCTLGNIF